MAQFPGSRNWGYDGVFPFAVQSSYGGPEGLKRLVNASHQQGMAVVLDVVYNHLGPEGTISRTSARTSRTGIARPGDPRSTSTVRRATR